jgi:hypothetical protein
MLIENVRRFADDVCSLDTLSNLLSGYTETNDIRNRTIVKFIRENVNKK